MSPGFGGYAIRVKWVAWLFMVGFGTLACLASVDIQTDMFLHSWPPIIVCDEFLGFESSWMSSYDGIVVFLNDVSLKLNVGWNIKKVFVIYKSVFIVIIVFVFCF